jgi:hypothetical protein
MAKKMSPLDIMNAMGDAADKKAKKPSKSNPDPDHDGDNDMIPSLDTDKDAGNPKAKQAAAIGAKKKSKGQLPPMKK